MISENMARIIAKISGDGHLATRQIMYFNTCPTLIKEFVSDMRRVFGNIRMSEGFMNSGTPYVAIYGKHIVKRLIEYLPSYNSFNIFIPKEIIYSGENICKEYLRTFYDDEGCACLRLNKNTTEWKRNITLASNSHEILTQINDILNNWGIKTNRIIRNNSSSNYDKSFVLGITGKENFILFRKMIGFKHPRKIKLLNLIIQSYGATSRNIYEFNKIKEKLNELVVPKK